MNIPPLGVGGVTAHCHLGRGYWHSPSSAQVTGNTVWCRYNTINFLPHKIHTYNDTQLYIYFNHLPRMFLSTDFAFRIMDWTCCHGPHLHAILRIISRGGSGLATHSPCSVWGRGWTTCLLHDSTLGVIFHIFIISCLGSWFHAWN